MTSLTSLVTKLVVRDPLLRLNKANYGIYAKIYPQFNLVSVVNRVHFVIRRFLRLPTGNVQPSVNAGARRAAVELVRGSARAKEQRLTFVKRLLHSYSVPRPLLPKMKAIGGGVTLGLVAVKVRPGTEPTLMSKDDHIEVLCEEVRRIFAKRYQETCEVAEEDRIDKLALNLQSLEFGSCISKGCNGAVYNAKLRSRPEEPLAVKVMFNYDVESNGRSIYQAMQKECLPFSGYNGIFNSEQISQLKQHPNIVRVRSLFAAPMPLLDEAKQLFPSALPPRLCELGYGRNMTLFLVMNKYDLSLLEFVRLYKPSEETATLLLTQLFEGIDFLVRSRVAHRDLKSDNLLLDLTHGTDAPWLVITDFGCSLPSLTLDLTSNEVNRGGNAALMAPEIALGQPGYKSKLDYSRSDLWAAGAIAYEIFGGRNPFYKYKGSHSFLTSDTYEIDELEPFPSNNRLLAALIPSILSSHPADRPSPRLCATLGHMIMNTPSDFCEWLWNEPDSNIALQKLLSVVLHVSIKLSSQDGQRVDPVRYKLCTMFLSQVSCAQLKELVEFVQKL